MVQKNQLFILPVLVGCFFLSGCGVNTAQIRAEIKAFKCTAADFDRLEKSIAGKLDLKGSFQSNQGAVYDLFEQLNQQLGAQCPQAVLAKCSPTHSKVVTGWALVGPINSFGVAGKVTIRRPGTVPINDDLGSIVHSTSVNGSVYAEGMACYKKALAK